MKSRASQSRLAGIALLLAVGAMQAEDWPQFRGPNRDGVWNETGLLKTFPADGLKIRWRAPVGGGWSSPVVAKGRVYLADSLLAKPAAKERVLCLDAATGKPLWTFAYDVTYSEWAFVPGQGGGPTATPVVEAGKVFTVGINGHVHCLDARTGAVRWERNLQKSYEVRDHSCRPSPLIEGNLLIVFTGAKPNACVLALDKRTGKEIWKALNEPASSSSPFVVTGGGKRQLIVWTDASVTSLNPATGEVWWREPMVTSGNDSIPTPVVQKNRLLISGLMFVLDDKQPIATVLWPTNRVASKRLLSNTSSPILRGDHIYSAKSSGELACLEAGTGALVWRTNTVTGLKSGASIHLTLTPDAMFLFTDEGNLIRAQVTPEGYRELSRSHLIESTTPFGGHSFAWSPPAYANRHVFARNEKEMVCASLADKK
jgi:outer membrane protein assembly factor BamB